MSTTIEVWLDRPEIATTRVGTLYGTPRRNGQAVSFSYHADWLTNPQGFALEPSLPLTLGAFTPAGKQEMFGSIGDSAPDTWGRRLMQRAERRRAEQTGTAARTLLETHYLLGVSDLSRLGALRFRTTGDTHFQAPSLSGVPKFVQLGRLFQATERLLRHEETDDDLLSILAPGSSLGGARPKASILDRHGQLSIAKFPKETDEYSIERWEAIALTLANRAAIRTASFEVLSIAAQPILLSQRFDRNGPQRLPFLSALSMLSLRDGQRGSYPEMVDALAQHGTNIIGEAHELFRRMVFNVLISNVDDHLRNHGFLRITHTGWVLAPAYDLNPTPSDIRPRILSTNITLDEGSCDIDLVCSAAPYFNLRLKHARNTIKEVAMVVANWREVAEHFGAKKSEVLRMQSAFEHQDLEKALRF